MTPLQMLLMKGGNALNKADEFMQKPGGNFLMNLLAQSGYSTTPDSPLGAVGRAGIMTQQQQRQSQLDDMQKRLIESQISRNERDPVLNAPKPAATIQEYNLYSSQEIAAGRIPMSFEAYKKKYGGNQFFTLPDNSVVTTPRNDPGSVTTIITPEQAAEASGRAAKAKDVEKDPQRARELPQSILAKQQQIDRINGFIDALTSGSLDTGPIQQAFSRFTPIGQDFQSFTGENVLNLISQATFGALSEGEREFLTTISFGLGKDEEINKKDLERYRDILVKAIEIESSDLNRIQQNEADEFSGFSIAKPK